jgi:hypothetical protein
MHHHELTLRTMFLIACAIVFEKIVTRYKRECFYSIFGLFAIIDVITGASMWILL